MNDVALERVVNDKAVKCPAYCNARGPQGRELYAGDSLQLFERAGATSPRLSPLEAELFAASQDALPRSAARLVKVDKRLTGPIEYLPFAQVCEQFLPSVVGWRLAIMQDDRDLKQCVKRSLDRLALNAIRGVATPTRGSDTFHPMPRRDVYPAQGVVDTRGRIGKIAISRAVGTFKRRRAPQGYTCVVKSFRGVGVVRRRREVGVTLVRPDHDVGFVAQPRKLLGRPVVHHVMP